MNNSYDQIATVTIDIATAIVDTASFDKILIIGPLPKIAPLTTPALCGVYRSIEEVTAAGWAITGADADPVGVAAKVAFAQNPAPSEIYIAPIQTTTTEGTTTPEYAVVTAQRASATPGWYCICPAGVADTELSQLADYVETQEKMMVYTDLDFFKIAGDSTTVAATHNRTAAVYGKESSGQDANDVLEENKYINVAFAVKWLSYEAGSETAAFKQLSAVSPADLTSTEQDSLKTKHVNYLTTIGGKNITMNGQVLTGEWCDIIRFRDWQKNDMQVAVASLFITQSKIPFTDGGISLIQNAMEASLQRGQEAGGIAETSYDADGNESLGYQVYVPQAADVSDTSKAARELPNCKFTAKLTGAVHFVEINGSLAYSL